MKRNFDKHHGVRPLDIGQHVYVPDMKIEGEVQGACAPRSFLIGTPKDVIRRNHRDLRELPEEHTEKPEVLIPEAPSEAPAVEPEPQETVTTPKPKEAVFVHLRRKQRTSKPPKKFEDYNVRVKYT